MKILALDDSETALKLLVSAISEALPQADISAFGKPSELLDYAKENSCNVAFLDIKMWGMDGLAVAKLLKEDNPKINIIFVTAYSKYATEAFDLYPSGYILKPVTRESVEREIKNLRHPVDQKSNERIYVQTFGNFEIFSYGTPLKFSYRKTKELLAYLVDRNGACVNMSEICAVLWEDEQDTDNMKAYLRKLTGDLVKRLKEAGADDVILKQHNHIAVRPDRIVCDSYGFMEGNPRFVNAYSGQYMAQYSWAEMTTEFLNKLDGSAGS